MTYFGFAIADSMFTGDVTIRRTEISVDDFRSDAGKVTSCLNPSHVATIEALKIRYGIDSITIPDTPPRVSLGVGDSIIVMGVRGLPRLTDRHQYTDDEIAAATFVFARYDVI